MGNALNEFERERGYSREEKYFFELNKELIEKRRKAREAAAATTAETRPEHWMKCPKCPGELRERDLAGIRVDQCGSCQGLFFDAGEVDVLLESKEPKGLLAPLKRLFSQRGGEGVLNT